MRAKSVALLLLALGCGAVASVGIIQVISKSCGDARPAQGEFQAIFVAVKDMPQGDPLTGQTLKLEQWPKNTVPPGALSRLDDIEGRRTRNKLFAGEPILDTMLAAKGVNAPGADIMIPKGYRVVSIRVDAVSGGADLLLPGCRVDLLVHMVRNPNLGIRETTTRTILQDIKVFAVNNVVTLDTDRPGDQVDSGADGVVVGHAGPGGKGDAGDRARLDQAGDARSRGGDGGPTDGALPASCSATPRSPIGRRTAWPATPDRPE